MFYYVSPIVEVVFIVLISIFIIAGLFLLDSIRKKKQIQKRISFVFFVSSIFLMIGFYSYLKQLM